MTFLGALVLSIHSTDRKYLEAEIFFFEMELANLTAIVRDRKKNYPFGLRIEVFVGHRLIDLRKENQYSSNPIFESRPPGG